MKNLGVYPNEVTPTQKLRVNVSFPFTSLWWFFPLKSPWQFDYHLDLRLKHVQPTSMPAYHGPAQGSSWILCMTCERFSKLYIYIYFVFYVFKAWTSCAVLQRFAHGRCRYWFAGFAGLAHERTRTYRIYCTYPLGVSAFFWTFRIMFNEHSQSTCLR